MNALEWVQSASGTTPPENVFCQTRDVAQARIGTLRILLLKNTWSEEQSAHITAIVGELVNNSFDHNLGTWRDIPGVWFEYQIEAHSFHAFIADRGQGVLSSLKKVLPDLTNDSEALRVAFTKEISGRAPEPRGNGLKFVLRTLQKLSQSHFLFRSGNARVSLEPPFNKESLETYIALDTKIDGIYVELAIKKI